MNDCFPTVSVQMPVYNGRKTLPLAIKSLQVQTFSDWEAVIVDDGSTDGSAAYIESLTESRIRLIKLGRNRGRAYARRVALEASRGKFLTFLDCDDFYHPRKLQSQVQKLNANSRIDYVSCAIASLDSCMKVRGVRGKRLVREDTFRYVGRFPVSPVASMIRSSAVGRVNYRSHIKLGEDTDFFFRAMQGRKLCNIPEVLYFYNEFQSVTLRKVYYSYLYTLMALPGQFKFQPSHVLQRLVLTLMKMATLPAFVVGRGWEGILERRGQQPGAEDIERLAEALDSLRAAGATL